MRLARKLWLLLALYAPLVATGQAGEMNAVESKTIMLRDVRLQGGATLREVRLAYETYGKLDANGRNAILVTHGYTSSHHAAGRYAPGNAPPGVADEAGGWDGLIGPGKPIDTDRTFVISSNMLGSSYGSTSPKSINPQIGKPYGPDFPDITLKDIVSVQKQMLDELGVKHLVAVAGGSFGGYQAFQWAVTFPDFMDGIVAVGTAPRGRGDETAVAELIARLAQDPNWNGGWYYDRGGIPTVMTELRIATLKNYGIDEGLAARFPDPAERDAAVHKMAAAWVNAFDGHSLVALRKASVRFDAEKDFGKIEAKLLYVLSTTDNLFPPSIAPAVMEKLEAAGVDATFFELKSKKGHLAAGADAALWAPALQDFMNKLSRQTQ